VVIAFTVATVLMWVIGESLPVINSMFMFAHFPVVSAVHAILQFPPIGYLSVPPGVVGSGAATARRGRARRIMEANIFGEERERESGCVLTERR